MTVTIHNYDTTLGYNKTEMEAWYMRILVVEDDESIANLIQINLTAEGYDCTCAYDGKTGADYIETESFDLILLDIMLPEINGYELLEYIKPIGTPVIFLTAKSGVDDRIKGLKLGADDYISKPFQVGELIARVEALLRRCGKSNNKLSFADVEIDTVSRTIKKAGIPIDLTVKEFDLLVVLIENKNVALYRERLYEKVWGETYLGDTRTLDSHIQRLRRKLGWDNYIKTVFRVGYRLEDRE
jgi:DNA-binding response OmpR family regulator